MTTVDKVKHSIIDKILSINDPQYLAALDKLISKGVDNFNDFELSPEQKAMLEMSENDIKNGRLISQEAMIKRNLEWLNDV